MTIYEGYPSCSLCGESYCPPLDYRTCEEDTSGLCTSCKLKLTKKALAVSGCCAHGLSGACWRCVLERKLGDKLGPDIKKLRASVFVDRLLNKVEDYEPESVKLCYWDEFRLAEGISTPIPYERAKRRLKELKEEFPEREYWLEPCFDGEA